MGKKPGSKTPYADHEVIVLCTRCSAEVPRKNGRVFSRSVYCDICGYHINMQILKWHKDGRVITHQALADKLEITLHNLYKRVSRLGIGNGTVSGDRND